MAVVLVTHRMAEIQELADRTTVLRDGSFITTIDRASLTIEKVVTSMVGRSLQSLYGKRDRQAGRTRLVVDDLRLTAASPPNTLHVRAGEVVSIAGLIGSGRSELALAVCGVKRPVSGQVSLDGEPIAGLTVANTIRRGLVMVYESRKDQGLILGSSIFDNIVVANLRAYGRAGVVNYAAAKSDASSLFSKLRIKATGLSQPVNQLSGGNQQKVLLARCLSLRPKVVILDEPTRGVDVGAKVEIYEAINDLARSGTAVLLISSERPEVIGMGDRILVMRDGAIVADLSNQNCEVARTSSCSSPRGRRHPPPPKHRLFPSNPSPHRPTEANMYTIRIAESDTLGQPHRPVRLDWLRSNLGVILALFSILVVMSFAAPNFLSVGNMIDVSRQISVIAILSVGITFVLLTGGLDLSGGLCSACQQ